MHRSTTESSQSLWSEFWAGIVSMGPVSIANAVWGLVTGVAMVESGMTDWIAAVVTMVVYAGSAQLAALPLLSEHDPLWLVFVATFVINVRFTIYSAGMFPYFRDQPWWRRFLAGFYTSDFAFSIFMTRVGGQAAMATREQRWHYYGTCTCSGIVWLIFSFIGIFLAAYVPRNWSLEFAATLALLAITLPLAKSRPMLAALLASGVTAWVGQALPLHLGLLAAIVVGIVAGVFTETRKNG